MMPAFFLGAILSVALLLLTDQVIPWAWGNIQRTVISAVEGLTIATDAVKPFVIPLTLGILLGLFALQSHGTGALGKWFGGVMLVSGSRPGQMSATTTRSASARAFARSPSIAAARW